MTEVVTCAAGIGLTEGPLWTNDGRLLVTSISRGRVYEVSLDGSPASVVLEVGGGPSGMAQSGDGPIWIANGNRTDGGWSADQAPPRIQRWDGASDAADTVIDRGITPNDIAIHPDGTVWFTNPTGHPFDLATAGGSLRLLDPESNSVTVVCDGLLFPNGLAFGVDPDELFVAETAARRITRLRRSRDGWSAPEIFAEIPEGHPDGIAFDGRGCLHVAATQADAIFVFDGEGRAAERIDLGSSFPTSCAFAGPDGSTLAVTVARGGRVLSVQREVPGLLFAAPYDRTGKKP